MNRERGLGPRPIERALKADLAAAAGSGEEYNMCGILGVIAPPGRRVSAERRQLEQMRDAMAMRGPDGAGLVERENVVFAHRRLAIIDLEAGEQPMWTPDRRRLLVYNGELYNDAEVRAALREEGVVFQSRCDTETVLHALDRWGTGALTRLRGMFALGWYDFETRELLLVRDPLGIKPLYVTRCGPDVVFGSHLPAILGHPRATVRPNWATVSAYLTTLRTTLGNHTLFEGVLTLRPGELLTVRFDGDEPRFDVGAWWQEPSVGALPDPGDAVQAVRREIIGSVEAHLRADVPRCGLLSGGLDSSIITTLCRDLRGDGDDDLMRTWCAGADLGQADDDFSHAAIVARHLGTEHHEVVLTEDRFRENWRTIVDQVGLPVSTPNETAIYAVCKDLSAHARVVLSGEGADELFVGYAGPILAGLDGVRSGLPRQTWPGGDAAATRFEAELIEQYGTSDLAEPVRHYLRVVGWVAPEQKAGIFRPGLFDGAGADQALYQEVGHQFALDADGGGGVGSAEQVLRVHRRLNLTGLLRRLDTASMLAGVEGRTPFADVRVAELALRLPVEANLGVPLAEDGGWQSAARALASGRVQTKRLLRQAFAEALPMEVVNRPKASFPLPFNQWLGTTGAELTAEPLVREVFDPDVLATLGTDPGAYWQAAWPILNVASWLRRWWG